MVFPHCSEVVSRGPTMRAAIVSCSIIMFVANPLFRAHARVVEHVLRFHGPECCRSPLMHQECVAFVPVFPPVFGTCSVLSRYSSLSQSIVIVIISVKISTGSGKWCARTETIPGTFRCHSWHLPEHVRPATHHVSRLSQRWTVGGRQQVTSHWTNRVGIPRHASHRELPAVLRQASSRQASNRL